MKPIRMAAGILGAICLFVLGVFVESYIRSFARESIPVEGAGDLHGTVEAYVQPDFLWAGQAWWIELRTKVPVQLEIDDEWHATIPAGTNTLYSNHDANNTTEFSANGWWKTPSKITVRERSQQSLGGDSENATASGAPQG